MSEETQTAPTSDTSSSNNKRRRRRRRRPEGEESSEASSAASGGRRRGGRSRGRRGHTSDPNKVVGGPDSGKNRRRRRSRRRRGAPVSGANRRRGASKAQLTELETYFEKMDFELLSALYRGLGGQPGRIEEKERVVTLTVKALAQGSRLKSSIKACHERERTALAILIQCGGLAHSVEFISELTISLGGQESEWQKVMLSLANKGLIFSSKVMKAEFFYIIPEPLVELIIPLIEDDMTVPVFKQEGIEVQNQSLFSPPLDFSITTLCTYVDRRPPRLTQQQEIYKAHKEEMDQFFSQIWSADSDLFHFHIEFLMTHGIVELRGDSIRVDREVVDEWLNLDEQDQRDLIFRALDKHLPYAEWVIGAVLSGGGEWVPERPLSALYRRWKRGEDWRKRLHSGDYGAHKSNQRESWSFAPLIRTGMLELGEWGQEKFYRLTPRAKSMMEDNSDDEFKAFYLTPAFEIMAPAGLSPELLFRIGELSELTGCDRANTYRITQVSIEGALNKGWRRDDLLDFLRDNSQIGLPENVEQTMRDWMGYTGDVEFHDTVVMTVHNSRIRKFESSKTLKPYILHKYVPGLYAVDRSKVEEIMKVLNETGFHPSQEVQHYPGSEQGVEGRLRLHELVAEARATAENPLARAHNADSLPEDLFAVEGSSLGKTTKKRRSKSQPPRVSPREAKNVINDAIRSRSTLEILYLTKDGKRVGSKVTPTRLAVTPGGDEVMVARDIKKDELRTYKLIQIERMGEVVSK